MERFQQLGFALSSGEGCAELSFYSAATAPVALVDTWRSTGAGVRDDLKAAQPQSVGVRRRRMMEPPHGQITEQRGLRDVLGAGLRECPGYRPSPKAESIPSNRCLGKPTCRFNCDA